MSNYIVGDVHGCFKELQKLLKKVFFNKKKDTLWSTGDLVARGPESLKVLLFFKSLGKQAKLVLGNHDLHLISSYYGVNNKKNKDYNNYLLNHFHSKEIINWLCSQPLLQIDDEKKIIMSHAGISPQWDLETAKKCAFEIHLEILKNSKEFFKIICENNTLKSRTWNKNYDLNDRLRFSTNVFTKMRYCYSKNGNIDMNFKQSPKNIPLNIRPWFSLLKKIPHEYNIIFGHWSQISSNYLIPKKIYALDTGCCWGENLTMLRWEDKKIFTQHSLKIIKK